MQASLTRIVASINFSKDPKLFEIGITAGIPSSRKTIQVHFPVRDNLNTFWFGVDSQ